MLAICAEDPDKISGGMGRAVGELNRALAKRDDVEVDLLTIGPASIDGRGNARPFVEFQGFRKWTFDTLIPQKPRSPSIRAVLQVDVLWMSRLLEMVHSGYRWDVLHANEWSSMQVAQIASRVLGIPIVSTMHLCLTSLWDLDKPMKVPRRTKKLLTEYREAQTPENVEPLTKKQRKEFREISVVQKAANFEADLWISNQEGKLCVETEELILCSHAYCEIAETYFHINSILGKSPFMIPNGIDLGAWHPGAGDAYRARETHDKIGWRPIALFAGRIATMKGISYLLQAVTDEDTGYQIVLAGDVNADIGEEDWYVTQWIRALEAKYPNRLAWVGFQHDQELKDLYAAAECAIVPSITDPYNIVLDELWGSGVPAIATDVDGMGERVRDEEGEEYALIIPPRDSKAIRKALHEMKDEKVRDHWRAQGLKRVQDPRFNWDQIAEQVTEVYRQTIRAYHGKSTH